MRPNYADPAGWENGDFTAPMNQHTVFPINSRHRVVCPNRVVKLRRNTVWLEHDFEGSDEIEFEVSAVLLVDSRSHSAGGPETRGSRSSPARVRSAAENATA